MMEQWFWKKLQWITKEMTSKHIKNNNKKINEAETTRSQLKWLRINNTGLLASFSWIDLL